MVLSAITARNTLKITKQKMVDYQVEFLERMNAIEIDAHWFRRAFHTFAASFLFYYLLPDKEWMNTVKIALPIIIVLCMAFIEYNRIQGGFNQQRFFGLRVYERKRPASYLYFGAAALILLLMFPQQIAIPCILCGSFSDPMIGEFRYYLGKKNAYIIGFIGSLFFFLITWYKADLWVIILVSLLGATGTVIGEAKKNSFIDDDFMIQILPAIVILLIWQGILIFGIDILPPPLLYPL